jgi:hypothetical protein
MGAPMISDGLKEQKDTSSVEVEQRECKRLLVKDNVFAALRGGFKKVGKINDISLNGLGFSYLKKTGDVRPHEHDDSVDIFLPQNGFHLFNIPCRTVYEETGVAIVEGFPLKLSRCGLHFGKLSDMQLSLLDFIITKVTIKRRPKSKMPIAQDIFF